MLWEKQIVHTETSHPSGMSLPHTTLKIVSHC